MIDSLGARKIILTLQAGNFETRFIGGCVRDFLLQRTIADIDLATTALPGQVIEVLQAENIHVIPTGLQHGTVTAVINGTPFEITTLRHDLETDGRHAAVAFTDNWEEDAKRRDFTINALSCDAAGNLHDYCGGLDDLAKKRLRFIGDARQRIQEDYLRILRYFRFLSVLEWPFENEALDACNQFAPLLKNLSRERVQNELYKLLSGPACIQVARQMNGIWLSLSNSAADLQRFENVVARETVTGQKDSFRRSLALFGWENPGRLEEVIVLTRDDKRRLKDLAALENETGQTLNETLYFYGQQTVLDFYFLHDIETDFSVIQSWQKPVFPLKAEHVFALTDGPGPAVGILLNKAEKFWVKNDFKPNLQTLIAWVSDQI